MIIESSNLIQESDKKNLQIIDNLVTNHFSLSVKSLEYFKKELYTPSLAEEINNIFSKYNSTRIYIKLEDDVIAEIDKGYSSFKYLFGKFIADNNVKFENFKKNYIVKDKNNVKIKKVLTKYAEEIANKILDIFNPSTPVNQELIMNVDSVEKMMEDIKTKSSEILNYNVSSESVYDERFFSGVLSNLGVSSAGEMVFNIINKIREYDLDRALISSINTHYSKLKRYCLLNVLILSIQENSECKKNENISNIIANLKHEAKLIEMEFKNSIVYKYENEFATSSVKKLSKDEVYLVLSINYADWFLCSTSESWGSCLNLQGDMVYWYGLPGLIGDKNRVLAYLTTKEKKNYRGIEADKMITRSWALLDEENNFNFVRWYPNNEFNTGGVIELLNKETGNKFIAPEDEGNYYKTKYYLEPMLNYHDKGIFPYLDYSRMKSNDDGIYIEYSNSGSIYTYCYDDYQKKFEVKGDTAYDDDDEPFQTLGYLIENKTDFLTAISEESIYCSECNGRVCDNEDYFIDGYHYCEHCYHNNFITCEQCQEPVHSDNYIETGEGDYVCEYCLNRHYFHCYITDDYYHNDDKCYFKKNPEDNDTFESTNDILSDNDYLRCDMDGIYYKSSYLIEDKNGDMILLSSVVEEDEEIDEAV